MIYLWLFFNDDERRHAKSKWTKLLNLMTFLIVNKGKIFDGGLYPKLYPHLVDEMFNI